MTEAYCILAVDDEPFNLELIRSVFLEHDNVNISFARSGKEALKKLQENIYDVVLLDVQMPDMNGIEVLKQIKSQEKFDYLPVLMITANHELEIEALDIGANDFITKPFKVDILRSRTINYAKLSQSTRKLLTYNETLEKKVFERTKQLQESLKISKETEYEISTRLGRASESRDPETGGHIRRMSHYSRLLAELYGLNKEDCETVLYAAPLHDIGKIAIQDRILLKPGRFNNEEFEIMKTHVTEGAKMLEGGERFPVIQAGHIIALQHHEKYDGSGYPNGLKGEEIHLYARIVAIADVFDALSSKRVYKEAIPLEEVLEIMKAESGKHFDPYLIQLFLKNLERFLEIKKVFKNDNIQVEIPFLDLKSKEKRSMLYVDDNELSRTLIQEILDIVYPDLMIDIYAKAKEVLYHTNLNRYDLILTDIKMPDINGYEFIDILRKEKKYQNPVIAVSAPEMTGSKENVLSYGFDGYIQKPVDLQQLTNELKKFLD